MSEGCKNDGNRSIQVAASAHELTVLKPGLFAGQAPVSDHPLTGISDLCPDHDTSKHIYYRFDRFLYPEVMVVDGIIILEASGYFICSPSHAHLTISH